MTIPEVIRQARQNAKMTQKQLGEALGYQGDNAQAYVAMWERGTKPVPNKHIKPMAKILDIDIADLLP